MNVLAVDGALGGFSAAIACDGIVAGRVFESGNVALERGLSAVSAALRDAGRVPAEIDRLAVGIGPGTFTGLRIAIAYAKALAAVWGRPLVPIDSFDILEFGRTFDDVLTVVVGRPGVISARYRFGGQTRRASGRNGRRPRRPASSANAAARRSRRAGGRAPRACRTRHYRAPNRTARLPGRCGRRFGGAVTRAGTKPA